MRMKISKLFVEYIKRSCDVDEASGDLVCKKCGNKVIIDWFEYELECQGCDEL